MFFHLALYLRHRGPAEKEKRQRQPESNAGKIVKTPTKDAETAPDKSKDFFLYPIKANRKPSVTLPAALFNKVKEDVDGSCA
jgi:hypothetical protein